MAISTNGGSNPTKVTYNGKNCTEVWYKSSPSAEAVKVWPNGDMYAYLVQNHWPSLYSTAHLDHNPRWVPAIEVLSQDNPNSLYFTSANIPAAVPFNCTIYPVITSKTYQLDYWTLTAPDGTVQKFTDTEPHTILFDQAGTWTENSYWKRTYGINDIYIRQHAFDSVSVTNTNGEQFSKSGAAGDYYNSGINLDISSIYQYAMTNNHGPGNPVITIKFTDKTGTEIVNKIIHDYSGKNVRNLGLKIEKENNKWYAKIASTSRNGTYP